MDNFVVFILSHGRVDNIYTVKSLRKHGYTGKIVFVCDNEDKTLNEYFIKFKEVEVFNKLEISKTFDIGDNFEGRNVVVYARNAVFDIAKRLGYKYFIVLDDDYTGWDYRLYSEEKQKPSTIYDLDSVFLLIMDFYKKSNFLTLSIAQGGDFIGGKYNKMAKKPTIFRKCMNSFFCSTERQFNFVGRINEDVNMYVRLGNIGKLIGQIPMVSLTQKVTQSNKGGLTDFYLDKGTYVKSFYTVMFSPSCCYVRYMGDKHKRLHHAIKWNNAVPKILSPDLKK